MCYGKKGSRRRQISCGTWKEQQGRTNTSLKRPPLAANEIVEHPSMKRYRAGGAAECLPGEPRCHHNVTSSHNITWKLEGEALPLFLWPSLKVFCWNFWKRLMKNRWACRLYSPSLHLFNLWIPPCFQRSICYCDACWRVPTLPLPPPGFSGVWKGARLVCGFPESHWFLSPVGGCR